MKKRITFEIDEKDPLYIFLVNYSKEHFTTLTNVIKLSLQKLKDGEKE